MASRGAVGLHFDEPLGFGEGPLAWRPGLGHGRDGTRWQPLTAEALLLDFDGQVGIDRDLLLDNGLRIVESWQSR